MNHDIHKIVAKRRILQKKSSPRRKHEEGVFGIERVRAGAGLEETNR